MMKKHYRTGGSIREQAQPVKTSKLPMYADDLIESLYKPLHPRDTQYILFQDEQGVARSKIAKKLGISKARVVHEIILLQEMSTRERNKYRKYEEDESA
ncbi:hypothetical protein MKY98_02970 [Paenibacillus sp. FSL M8-0228]|uniref:hypothetical protein n=1 Tax=Paenibacillus sp. FSL M8-0228 TaxID=2921620 RepID=UPI0030F87017